MWTGIFLFIFYTIICSFFIQNNAIVKASNINSKTILFLFLFKLLGGLLYHYINTIRYYGGDSHTLHIETVAYLNTNSKDFWQYFFMGWNKFRINENIFSTANAQSWSNLSNQINYRFLTICNVLSFRHEVVNYIFYNTFFFIGQMALFNVFKNAYPHRKNILLLFIACLPSISFWCSGVHKDGFVLCFLGLLLYYSMRYFQTKNTKYFLLFIVFVLCAIGIRYYLSLVLIPFIVLYFISQYHPRFTNYIFGFGILLFLVCFFNVSKICSINPPAIVCYKQSEFISTRGDSYIATPILQPSAMSFLQNVPTALNHCMMRPYIWESKDLLYIICSVETTLLFLLLIFLLFTTSFTQFNDPLFLFCASLSLSMFIIIGYIVPFSGAFIRYRSEYLPFIYGVLLGSSSWQLLDTIEKKLNKYII